MREHENNSEAGDGHALKVFRNVDACIQIIYHSSTNARVRIQSPDGSEMIPAPQA